jgi:hypothetical protein
MSGGDQRDAHAGARSARMPGGIIATRVVW